MTAGELRKALNDVPDDVVISYQRIDDVYFNEYNWKTHKLLFDCYQQYHERSEIENETVISPEHHEFCYSEYIDVFSAYLHPENIFVLNAHY